MKIWSEKPVSDFVIKIFLDTNILSYLVDDTYPGLTASIQFLQASDFATLVSSNYGVFEFAGIRKKEHFLRIAISSSTKVNVSSLLKYKENFELPEIQFSDVKEEIKERVQSEMNDILNLWGIDYESNVFHEDLLNPTVQFCLSTKISKEDSLILISAIYPESAKQEANIVLLTKDEQFHNAYQKDNLSDLFKELGLDEPLVESIAKIKTGKKTLTNLTVEADALKIKDVWIEKLTELIIKKNASFFLGKTIIPATRNIPDNCIPFNLTTGKALPQGVYLTIISKDLDFVYTSKHPINEFQRNNIVLENNYISKSNDLVSFVLNDESGNPLNSIISSDLRSQCLVFVHPDSDMSA